MATGQSKVPYQKIQPIGSVQNGHDHHNMAASLVDIHDSNVLIEEKAKRLERRAKNTWSCIHFRLPVTGRLEKRTLSWITAILLIDAVANLCLFMTTHKWWFFDDALSSFSWQDLHDDFTSFHTGFVAQYLSVNTLSDFNN